MFRFCGTAYGARRQDYIVLHRVKKRRIPQAKRCHAVVLHFIVCDGPLFVGPARVRPNMVNSY